MSVFSLIESFLRGIAFLSQLITFILLHIIEYFIRPLYFPFFGEALTNFLKASPNVFLTKTFAVTFMDVYNIKIVPVGLVISFFSLFN